VTFPFRLIEDLGLQESALSFDDSEAYERFMGRWSRAAGAVFLDWLDPPAGASWLDVGCGTGIFTELILKTCSPAVVWGVDPAPAQVAHACAQAGGHGACFSVAAAEALPFADASFDVVSSALVINFIADRPPALAEMGRVVRRGGRVAGYVWDFESELSPSWPMRAAMRRIGEDAAKAPGTDASSLEALALLFETAGLAAIETRSFEVTLSFVSFEDFWQAQTPSYSPLTRKINAMSAAEHARFTEAVRAELSVHGNGEIRYAARANAIKSRL
jgi:ubiquinone/menaquinone biosynthesis C-methylase UbiE